METGKYTYHRRALMALWQLDPEEQAQVKESLAALAATPVEQWTAQGARRLPGDPAEYLVKVTESFRAIVRAGEGQLPEVLDLVSQDTLKFFAALAAGSGNGKR